MSSASVQSSVVAPKKSTIPSCVKFLLPSGLVNVRRMSPAIDTLLSGEFMSEYFAWLRMFIVKFWSRVVYFGLHPGSKWYVTPPVVFVVLVNPASGVVPSSVMVKSTFMFVTFVPLSMSLTVSAIVRIWFPVLFAIVLFPTKLMNVSVSFVTVKLFHAIVGVVFLLFIMLLAFEFVALNLK